MAPPVAADPGRKRKAVLVTISSSSSSSSEDMDDDEESEEEDEDEDDGEEEESEVSSSDEGDDDDDSEYEYEDEQDDDASEEEEETEGGNTTTRKKKKSSSDGGGEGEDELCSRVVGLLQRRQDLNILKLEECKTYLRKHGLRLSGSKAVCILRIQEHWRLKDGNGEKHYPRSSFNINCTGDVCRGDIILFKQKVYEKFDIVTRGGRIIGNRIIAGRVVKESYGLAKQQHTFTVEILWSKGVKALRALFPLLVKGRNLYRLKTFRQSWDNEAERSKILAEKHKRGVAARHARAIAKARSEKRGSKRHRHSNDMRAAPMKQRKKEFKPKTQSKKQKNHHKNISSVHDKIDWTVNPRALKSSMGLAGQALPHVNGFQTQYTVPRGFPRSIDHHTQAEFNNMIGRPVFQANRGMPYLPNYQVNGFQPQYTVPQSFPRSIGYHTQAEFNNMIGRPVFQANRGMPYPPNYQANRGMPCLPNHQAGSYSTATAVLHPRAFNRSSHYGSPV